MGQKLVTNRNITVTGTSGSSIRFTKGVPTNVPDHALEDCMKAGAIPVEGEVIEMHKPAAPAEPAPTGVERKQRILDAIEQMVLLNERGTFNANGTPKQPQLEKAAGFALDTREIETLWHEFDADRKSNLNGVDANEVVTINDPKPVVIENEAEAVQEEATAEESVVGQAAEGQEAPDESGQAADAVEDEAAAKRSESAKKAAATRKANAEKKSA